MIVAAAVAVIAWGALAFGAVYPWAFTPLLVSCALVGTLGVFLHRSRPFARSSRAAVLALVMVLVVGLLQLVPLPATVLRSLSPSTHAFLQDYDMAYALAVAEGGLPESGGLVPGSASHAISLAPRATLLGLAFLGAYTLFLAGLLRALSASRVR
nr:hypothetical protein [Acidobacteriota bacterium]